MSLIYVIEDDVTMAQCIALAARSKLQPEPDGTLQEPGVMIFHDAVTAVKNLSQDLPDVILLDVLLTGPDGFTFLNELISYDDTASIPVVLITSLNLSEENLVHYGVIGTLSKSTMTPEDIQAAVSAGLAKRYAMLAEQNAATLSSANENSSASASTAEVLQAETSQMEAARPEMINPSEASQSELQPETTQPEPSAAPSETSETANAGADAAETSELKISHA